MRCHRAMMNRWAVLWSLQVLEVLIVRRSTHALVFTTANHDLSTTLWDTWLYKGTGGFVLNYLAAHRSTHMWNSVGTALSSDGVHFADTGISLRKDCASSPDDWEAQPVNASDCSVWMGSGSVWNRLAANGSATLEGEYVINYSQQYDCGTGDCQAIFFATSTNLVRWEPVAPDALLRGGDVFEVDDTHYMKPGRWDTMTVLPREGGGYWGYWTAQPKPSPRSPTNSACAGKSCGAGFGYSMDGLTWTALPTPGPFSTVGLAPEVGGVAQLAGKVYMLKTFLFESDSPNGTFAPVAKNHNFFGQEGWSRFPRLWGPTYTGVQDLVLVTHQQCNFWHSYYVGLVKRAVLGSDGVLRVQWWNANDALKGNTLAVRPANVSEGTGCEGGTCSRTTCAGSCLGSGLWLEGKVGRGEAATGVWMQTATGGGFAFAVSTVDPSNVTFALGPTASAAFANATWVTTNRTSGGPDTIDRAMTFPSDNVHGQNSSSLAWRLVVRNAWSGQGMAEFYVNEVRHSSGHSNAEDNHF